MTKDRQIIVALERGLRVLQALSRAPGGLANGELAERTGLARSTISRLVHTLRSLDYIALDPVSRRYFLKPKVLTLGYSVLSATTLLQRARPALQRVSELTGETSGLAMRDGLHATFVDCARGRSMLAVQIEIGARLPLATSASGLALLKAAKEPERRQVVARLRANLTQNGIDHAAFDARLKAAIADDVVIVRDAWHAGIGGVALPVRFGDQIGALAIAVSTAVVTERTMREDLAPCLLEVARNFQFELAD